MTTTSVDLPLLTLGRGRDPQSERGVDCPGDLPAASDPDLVARARAAKDALGDRVFVLGHHYQQDSVVQHADLTGDSLRLSRLAAEEAVRRGTKWIVFCGVHFMAETADILTADDVAVILPDLSAGCSMADMADYDDAVDAWERIHEMLAPGMRVIPITYVNSTAAIKAFVGDHGGACCTSTNAAAVFAWALAGGTEPGKDDDVRILNERRGGLGIADVTMNEAMALAAVEFAEILEASRIRQLVERRQSPVRMRAMRPAHEIRSNEPGAAGDQHVHAQILWPTCLYVSPTCPTCLRGLRVGLRGLRVGLRGLRVTVRTPRAA